MNAVEIEQALSDLAEQTFDSAAFAAQFPCTFLEKIGKTFYVHQ